MQAGPFSGARGAEDPFIMVNSKSEPFSCNREKKKSMKEAKREKQADFLFCVMFTEVSVKLKI